MGVLFGFSFRGIGLSRSSGSLVSVVNWGGASSSRRNGELCSIDYSHSEKPTLRAILASGALLESGGAGGGAICTTGSTHTGRSPAMMSRSSTNRCSCSWFHVLGRKLSRSSGGLGRRSLWWRCSRRRGSVLELCDRPLIRGAGERGLLLLQGLSRSAQSTRSLPTQMRSIVGCPVAPHCPQYPEQAPRQRYGGYALAATFRYGSAP